MTRDERQDLHDYFDTRFDRLEEQLDLRLAAALGAYVRWRDLPVAISTISVLFGLAYVLTGHRP